MTATKTSAPSITFTDICLDFENETLFDHLSFSVAAGKCTCILGPSGCGKSTLLRMVSGNSSLRYSGSISFSTDNHQVGWMSQNDLLLPWMTLHDNVMLGARLRGEVDDSVRDRASMLLEHAGLSQYEKALPATLSGGMRQRGALLRTLMEERALLLMDEPFSALDALTRMKLQDLAAHMTRGKTVLLVTHDPLEALRMGDEIIVFTNAPGGVNRFADLPGSVPRKAGDPAIAPFYTNLLALLMRENV
ncbi:ABC transporter ATP-binding protein [Desulfopila inferna]|uniref:ABC transporter ATP-binding protein n=1 Tax=Desulfopila inferna TaxID=468528 RepID=UPI001964AEB3|nr:ABC transporter ATP-binding protein [Desulfopila inferna]MBM9605341.1 ABC transporter ATP-binding protein [Desulfopila inferna]